MSYLYFELNEPEERHQEYRQLLGRHAEGIKKSAEFLIRALQLITAAEREDERHYHGVVFVLARHVAEEVDATSVLVAEGCVAPCKSLLRSAFEADLGVRYILESDSENRAVAYLVKHARDRIRWYDKTDPESQAGKHMRSQIQGDNIATGVLSSLPPFDFDQAKGRFDGMLKKPPFAAVNDEWQRVKKRAKRHPAWHALFDGPKTVRDLAFHLDRGFWYEYLYSDWSGHVHAASGVQNIGPSSDDPAVELKAVRPLRHPDGMKDIYYFGQGMAVSLGHTLSQRYLSPIGQDDLRNFYIKHVRPFNEQLKNVNIKAPWW